MQKRYLLASVAVAVLVSTAPAQARGLYFSALGGANWWDDQSVAGGTDSTIIRWDTETGFMLGAALGLHLDNWLHGLRAEVEASYRRNNFDGNWSSTDSSGAIDGSISTFALMANVWYDINIGSKVKPYIGGGVGWARSHVDAVVLTSSGAVQSNGTSAFDVNGFAWQIGAGFNYEIMAGVDLGLGYRFREDPHYSLGGEAGGEFGGEGFGGEQAFKYDNRSHTVAINLTVDID